jgi:hypothetical protein
MIGGRTVEADIVADAAKDILEGMQIMAIISMITRDTAEMVLTRCCLSSGTSHISFKVFLLSSISALSTVKTS